MNQLISRRSCLAGSLAAAAAAAFGRPLRSADNDPYPTKIDTFGLRKAGKRIPVVFDTDIGDDIDDTWALLMLLKCPELDVKLVVADGRNTRYRARLLAKLLEAFGRSDIPVAIGEEPTDKQGRQSGWIGDYQLSQYPGKIYEDGIQALMQTIRKSPDPVTLVCTGPVPNIAAALRRETDFCRNARFVGMHGSVRLGYGGNPKPSAEWNVRAAPKALQAVFTAPWDVSVTPLDTCGLITLTGERYQRVYRSKAKGVPELIENYRVWSGARKGYDVTKRSSVLFDTVAVYMAFTEELLEMETVPLRVTDDGMTVIDKEHGRPVHCALAWKNKDAYLDLMVERLIS